MIVDVTTNLIYNTSTIGVAWGPSANVFPYTVSIILVYISSPTLGFATFAAHPDAGTLSLQTADFGSDIPIGWYYIAVQGAPGAGTSMSFVVSSAFPLCVNTSNPTSSVGDAFNVTWSPFDYLGFANVSLLKFADSSIILVQMNISRTQESAI